MSKFKRYERYKDSGVEWIGEIPEHWEINKLKRLSNIITGNTPPKSEEENYDDEGIPWVKPDNIQDDGTISETKERLSVIGLQKARLIPKSSAIVCCIGTVGKVGFTQEDCTTNQQINSIIFERPSIWNNKYGFYCLCSSKNEHEKYSNKVVVSILNKTQQGNILMPVPSLKEQKAIASFLDQKTAEIDDLIADKEKLIELLQEKRQVIITEAVTKGLNPNVRMKDSGIEWIGEIPEHWRLSKIKYESLINNKTLSESTDDDYEIDYIDISSVTSIGEIDGVQSLNFKDAPSRARRILSKGDTIVSTVRTYLKAIAFIENTQSNLICSTGFAVLTPLSKVVPKYLFYLMRSEKYVNEIVRRSVGVSYPAVNASDIGDLECALPDRDEQMYIVEYLDNCTTQINQLVNNIQAQIQKLKEYRQSLISEAVTGKIYVRDYAID